MQSFDYPDSKLSMKEQDNSRQLHPQQQHTDPQQQEQTLGSQAFFNFDDVHTPLGSRAFFEGDFPNFEDPSLYSELNGLNDSMFLSEQPPPEPGFSNRAAMLTKKRKSQAWDSKPLENRRKSTNFNAKPLDARRKTMYCASTSEPQGSAYKYDNSVKLEETVRYENNHFYSSGFTNPNHRQPPQQHHNPFTEMRGTASLQIEEPTQYMFDANFEDSSAPLSDLANLFIGPEKKEEGKPVSKTLLKKRRSEDWDSRPLEPPNTLPPNQQQQQQQQQQQPHNTQARPIRKDTTQGPGASPSNGRMQQPSTGLSSSLGAGQYNGGPGVLYRQRTFDAAADRKLFNRNMSMDSHGSQGQRGPFDFNEEAKQRRTKWTTEEVHTLWKGILLHGNNWSIIKDSLPSRTYYQIKDKGRRILYNQGWKTGRTKKDAGGASDDAKVIAQGMLHGRS